MNWLQFLRHANLAGEVHQLNLRHRADVNASCILDCLPSFSSLQTLSLKGIHWTEEHYRSLVTGLSSLTSLTDIDLRGAAVKQSLIDYLLGATQLRGLSLGWKTEFTNDDTETTDWIACLRENPRYIDLSRCRQLERLCLPGLILTSHDSVLSIARNCSFLTHLDLSNVRTADDEILSLFAASCGTRLQELNFRCNPVSDRGLAAVTAHCTRLTRINLSCTRMSPDGVWNLANACPALRDIDICYCEAFTSQDVSGWCISLARLLSTRLVMLGVGGFRCLSDADFEAVLTACPNLMHLGIGGCNRLTSAAILSMARLSTRLVDLNAHRLRGIRFESIRELVSALPSLKFLDLDAIKTDPPISPHRLRKWCEAYERTQDDWYDVVKFKP